MKRYQISVNGNTYEVEVEELAAGQKAAVTQAAPVVAAAPVAKPAAAPVAASGATGSIEVEAPMSGKIVDVKVAVGQTIAAGDVVAVLEAMKMENEIVSSEGGTVATVDVSVGDAVEAGDIIVSLN